VRRAARLRLGRVSDILANDPEFSAGDAVSFEDWCRRSGILYGGRADIGHDAQNHVVPFRVQNR
jgi:muramoyltetrapeptide carboxypeptidase